MLLELDHVSKHFGAVKAVDELSLTLDEGEVLGIMGPNGSGKTTLLNIIMGVYPLEQGEIRFAGQPINGLSTNVISHRGIGRTYQIPRPFQRMSVLENVLVGELYSGRHRSKHAAGETAMNIIERVGLGEKAEIESGKLGLLDLKRLELARAMSLRPRLLLLDEIAAGLVATEVEALQGLILEFKKDGQAILLIEHVLKVIFDLSDRILVLNFGQRIASGSPEEIAKDPRVHDVYLGTEKADDEVTSEPASTSPEPDIKAPALLELRNVNAGYGDFQALFDVSVEILEGEIVALIGVNGAGKTTLIRAINRQLPLISGEILFQGKRIVDLKPYDIIELGIAQCIEGRKLFPELTVHENVEIGAYCKRARGKRHRTMKRIYALFPVLANRRNQIASTLSGGEQQMLAVARALMALPELIMFDEISLGLAPLIIDNLYKAVADINRQGTTVLLVEQNVHRSLTAADRAYIIERGCIALSGASEALSRDEHVKEAYFGL